VLERAGWSIRESPSPENVLEQFRWLDEVLSVDPNCGETTGVVVAINEGTLAKLVDLVRLRSGGLQDDVSIALIQV
jgi:hypothetical protein